jgi:hypothetical protein
MLDKWRGGKKKGFLDGMESGKTNGEMKREIRLGEANLS